MGVALAGTFTDDGLGCCQAQDDIPGRGVWHLQQPRWFGRDKQIFIYFQSSENGILTSICLKNCDIDK